MTTTSSRQLASLQLRNGRALGGPRDIFVSPSGRFSWIQPVHHIQASYDALAVPGTGLFIAVLVPWEAAGDRDFERGTGGQ